MDRIRRLQAKARVITMITRSFFVRRYSRKDSKIIRLLSFTFALLMLFILFGFHKRNVYELCSSSSGLMYDVTIDAGSTGTRIHVYKFYRAGKELRLRSEFVQRVKPGLSSYANNIDGLRHSLRYLLQSAVAEVPKRYHRCTAITLKATAGLRLLSPDSRRDILSTTSALIDETPFLNRGSSVISGKEEGVYGWLTVNFLLGRLQTAHASSAVTVDMGGGSAQIVFATDESSELWLPLAYTSRFRIGGTRVTLYQHSYLGFGMVEARSRMLTCDNNHLIRSACTAMGSVSTSNKNRTHNGSTSASIEPSFHACVDLQKEHLFNLSKVDCTFSSCAIHGIPQPQLATTKNDVYVFSYFYDYLKSIDSHESGVHVSSYKTAGEKACSTISQYTVESNNDSNACMNLAYLYTFLRYGLGLQDNQLLHVENSIDGKAVAWTLGASLAYLLDIDV